MYYPGAMARTAPAIDLDALARVGQALADETRRRLLVALLAGPRYPADLADELGQGRTNISNHLACLRGCGLVIASPEGRRVRYELADPALAAALEALGRLCLAPPVGCQHEQ